MALRSTTTRAPARHVLLALLVVLPLAACGDQEDPQPSGAFPSIAAPSLPSVADGVSQVGEPKVISLVVTGGKVTGADSIVSVPRNTPVRLSVLADVADVLLVKGPDARAQLTVGQPVQLEFLAATPGSIPVVLERTGKVLTTLRVS